MPDNVGLLSNVSRETLKQLEAFAELVQTWTLKVNLVSKNSASEIWKRHILDSLQLVDYAKDTENWVDLGSGGGFPGIVVAVALKTQDPKSHVVLVESELSRRPTSITSGYW